MDVAARAWRLRGTFLVAKAARGAVEVLQSLEWTEPLRSEAVVEDSTSWTARIDADQIFAR